MAAKLLFTCLVTANMAVAQQVSNKYIDRFTELRNEVIDPSNGYLSPDGAPYHSIETLIVEAPDHGHEITSEGYSYYLWLEVMNGRITGDWSGVDDVWKKMEDHIIPTSEDQPTNSFYDASSPAAFAPEFLEPSGYPSPLNFNAPVGEDPVSPELSSTYGTDDIYGMHWLLDGDNFYGYGNRGDGTSTPSYINTFQRGEQESVWETVPHPSWEDFSWGDDDGYLPLFTLDANYAKQWRYTSAPDADARAVQAMYWAYLYAEEQGLDPMATLPIDKATKMGDYLRLGMFDKYFKEMGVEDPLGPGGSGYGGAHYLMSWYYSWGGNVPVPGQNFGWAFRIGASACHFGYQNPVAAYALSQIPDFKPASPNGARDWAISLDRQMEFYEYLQSKEGAIAGGTTNSWNGDYSAYPAGKSTFYDMAYDENPVYEDPGSGTWAGWQAWSVERIMEYYYLTNDAKAKRIADKWVAWLMSEVKLIGSDDFEIPVTLNWSGEPDTYTPGATVTNNNLSVTVTDYNKDIGIAAGFAKCLIYYAAATEKHDVLDEDAKNMAKELLDRMWNTYRTDKGLAVPESRGDYNRFFEQEVYIPGSFSGEMPNGDDIEDGVTFLDIRSAYKNDPDYQKLLNAYNAGTDYVQTYHRTWAQIEAALANAEYGFFFGEDAQEPGVSVKMVTPDNNKAFQFGKKIRLTAEASSTEGDITRVAFFANGNRIKVDTKAPFIFSWEDAPLGEYDLTARATDDQGNGKMSAPIKISVLDKVSPTVSIETPSNNASFGAGVDISVSVNAQDEDGILNNVSLFLDGSLFQRLRRAPYEFTLTGLSAGSHTIRARAVDNDRNTTVSSLVTFTVSTSRAAVSKANPSGKDRFETEAFEIFPNPSGTEFNLNVIDAEDIMGIRIYNTSGKMVEEITKDKISNGNLIFGKQLLEGFYTIHIKQNDSIKTLKVIKR